MKKWIIIAIIVVVVIVIVVMAHKAAMKKRDAADREILNGLTRKEFMAQFIPSWQAKYTKGVVDAWLNNDQYILDTAWNACKSLFERCDDDNIWGKDKCNTAKNNFTSPSDPMRSCVKPVFAGQALESFKKKKPNPLEVEWARKFWLPQIINDFGIEIHKAGVKDIINLVPSYIKKYGT